MQEAIHLAELCKSVTVIQNLEHLTGEERLAIKLRELENVKVIYNTVVESFEGDDGDISALRLRNTVSGEISTVKTEGVFVAIGQKPENEPFANVCKLNEYGYIMSDENCLTETEGVFVAGDCRTKRIRQITTATADGAVAAVAACRYLDR